MASRSSTPASQNNAAPASKPTSSGAGSPTMLMTETYEVKRIEFMGNKTCPILLQSRNGPCPLLAIANQLLLSNRLTIGEHQEHISLDTLVHLIAEKLIDFNPMNDNSDRAENHRKAVSDAIEILPTLAQGLDVNVKFAGVDAFEFDRNIGIFDMLGMNLYHGWVIDPLDESFSSLRSVSYNALVERVVTFDSKFGHDENLIVTSVEDPQLRKIAAEGEVAQRFLNQHASQLTYTGLAKLHEVVKERELCVFFRNNHFSTMFKFEGHLYLLCTDSSFKTKNAVAWERLTDINGDTELCSPAFGDPNAYLSVEDVMQDLNADRGVSADEALARQLQNEENAQSGQAPATRPISVAAGARPISVAAGARPISVAGSKANQQQSRTTVTGYAEALMTADEVLARQLQYQEDQAAGGTRPPRARQVPAADSKSSSFCRIC